MPGVEGVEADHVESLEGRGGVYKVVAFWGGGGASSLLGFPPPLNTQPQPSPTSLGRAKLLNFITLYMYSAEKGGVWGGWAAAPPPRCSVHGGRGGVYWGQPPLTSSPCKEFWVSECPPRSPSCPQDMSTFSRPQWGWYIPHSVLWGRIGGRGGGGVSRVATPPTPPPFQVPHLQRGRTHL